MNGVSFYVRSVLAPTCAVILSVFASAAQGSGPPNDDFDRAEVLSGQNPSTSGTTAGGTRQDPDEPDHYTIGPSDVRYWVGDHTVWYRWTAVGSGQTTMDTCVANIDSILAVYTGPDLASLVRVTDNNNACPMGYGSKVVFDASAGTSYAIAVGDAGGARENTFTLNILGAPPPSTSTTSTTSTTLPSPCTGPDAAVCTGTNVAPDTSGENPAIRVTIQPVDQKGGKYETIGSTDTSTLGRSRNALPQADASFVQVTKKAFGKLLHGKPTVVKLRLNRTGKMLLKQHGLLPVVVRTKIKAKSGFLGEVAREITLTR